MISSNLTVYVSNRDVKPKVVSRVRTIFLSDFPEKAESNAIYIIRKGKVTIVTTGVFVNNSLKPVNESVFQKRVNLLRAIYEKYVSNKTKHEFVNRLFEEFFSLANRVDYKSFFESFFQKTSVLPHEALLFVVSADVLSTIPIFSVAWDLETKSYDDFILSAGFCDVVREGVVIPAGFCLTELDRLEKPLVIVSKIDEDDRLKEVVRNRRIYGTSVPEREGTMLLSFSVCSISKRAKEVEEEVE